MTIETEALAALGIFFGCFGRAFLPFLKKKAESDQPMKWQSRYTWTIVFNLFISAAVTMMILPSFQVPPEFIFPLAFAYGWSSQDIINKLAG